MLSRPKPKGPKEQIKHIISGPSEISVSKINQIISIYVVCLWCGLLIYSLPPFGFDFPLNWFYVGIIMATFVTCGMFFSSFGATYSNGYTHHATLRSTNIDNCR